MIILVPLLDLKFLNDIAAAGAGTSNRGAASNEPLTRAALPKSDIALKFQARSARLIDARPSSGEGSRLSASRGRGQLAMLAELQRLGPWLFGLFLIAQVGGVLPLVYVTPCMTTDTMTLLLHRSASALRWPRSRAARCPIPIRGIAASPWITISAVCCCTGWSARFRSASSRS